MKSVLTIFAAHCIALLLPSVDFAADQEAKKCEPQVVGKIVKVEYVEEEIQPPNLVVTATGEVPTAGYEKTALNRVVYVTPPEDGIQDYFLMSTPPSGQAAQVVSKVKATNTWKGYTAEAPWIKGIRVHGLEEGIVVKMFKDK